MSKRKAKLRFGNAIKLTPGYLVADDSYASGGVTYERVYSREQAKINRGRGIERKHRTITRIDHLEAVQTIDALKKQVDYALVKHCVSMPFGWFTNKAGLKKLRIEIEQLRKQANKLNTVAEKVDCARRIRVGIIPALLDVSTEESATAIARTIRETLTAVRDALRSGMVKRPKDGDDSIRDDLHAPLLRCRNLDRLAVGLAGEAVKNALERIPTAKKQILSALKEGASPAQAGEAADLGAIEVAITWFEEGGIADRARVADIVERTMAVA